MLEPPRVQSVHFIGAAHAGGGGTWALHGQDGGQSIALGEETLFVFSDTLLSRTREPLDRVTPSRAHFLGNCAALSREATLDGALRTLRYYEDEQGFPREILAPSPLERMAGHRFWPQHGIAVDGRVVLFYLGIHQFEAKSTWGFRATGSGLARFDPRTGTAERVLHDGEWRLWPNANDVRMGTQVLRDGDDVYVFGSRMVQERTTAFVARVPVDAIEDASAYRYFAAGNAWSANIDDAHALANTSAELSVSFNAYLGAYVMVYVEGFSRELYLRTAPAIVGPYGPAVSVGRLPHRESAEVVALAFEHPRFARNGGKTIVVSYCQPHFTQNSLVAITFR